MVDTGNSVNVILLGIAFLETAIIIGNWINQRAACLENLSKSKDPQSRFYGFENKDIFELWIGVSALLIITWFSIFYLIPLYIAVLNLMNSAGVPASLSYISLTFSFVAIVLTITLNLLNHTFNVFTKVNSRNRDIALHERLDAIESALQGFEKKQQTLEPPRFFDNKKNRSSKLSAGLISIIGLAIFVFVTSLIVLFLYPNKSADISIAIFTGLISGGFILLFQRSILERD